MSSELATATTSTSHANPRSRQRGRIWSHSSVCATLAPHCVSTMPGATRSCTARLNARPRNSRTAPSCWVMCDAARSRDPMATMGAWRAASVMRREVGEGRREVEVAEAARRASSRWPARPGARHPCRDGVDAGDGLGTAAETRGTSRPMSTVSSVLPSSTKTSSLPSGCPATNPASSAAKRSKRADSLYSGTTSVRLPSSTGGDSSGRPVVVSSGEGRVAPRAHSSVRPRPW